MKSDGTYDKSQWEEALREGGPAARLGDQVQVTKVTIEANRILLKSMAAARKPAIGTTTSKSAWAAACRLSAHNRTPLLPPVRGSL